MSIVTCYAVSRQNADLLTIYSAKPSNASFPVVALVGLTYSIEYQ